MCGIVGYIGARKAQEVILSGLRRLEYRGYDSAGIALAEGGRLHCARRVGKLAALEAHLAEQPLPGTVGIGHTRWATHGAPIEANAHPHCDAAGAIAVVHNGIIENFKELRERLQRGGVDFRSATDTEVLPHLIRQHYEGNLLEAVRRALQDVRGAYAIAAICADEPDVLVAARRGSPLIVGVGEGEVFAGSDVPALMSFTRDVIYLGEGEVCELRRDGRVFKDLLGCERRHAVSRVTWDEAGAEKEGFPHFMLKEIHQQPSVLRHLLLSHVDETGSHIELPGLALSEGDLRGLTRVVIVACGTAWHAGLVGKLLIERLARVPVEVDLASEFRYGNRVLDSKTLALAISQSGETADTLEAVRLARREGARTLGVVNVAGSSVAREAEGVLYTLAGPEIGVASTKAYTSQLAMLALFAIRLGQLRGRLGEEEAALLLNHLHAIPGKLERCLDHQDAVRRCALNPRFRDARNAMFLGRGWNYPSALEGALKLKEISYIHVEGYAAGEMKHGPIALVTDGLPVVCIATRGEVYEKVISNIEEVRARGGLVLSVATEGDPAIASHSDHVLYVPDCFEPFSPIVVALPLQLLAYYIAEALGRDVDRPRNLAKSVTVE